MIALLGEIIAFLPTALRLGMDVAAIVDKAVTLANKPTPVTPEELVDLRAMINAQKVTMDGLTARLEADPPSGA
jgi:hypothetical protein